MTGLRIRRAEPSDRRDVADLLRGLSLESVYRRSQSGLGPGPSDALLDDLLPDGPQGAAVLAHRGRRLVGHGVWHRADAATAAEIGVVVADAHQREGIGTALAEVLLADVSTRNLKRVELCVAATNEAVTRMVSRLAPQALREYDGGTVTSHLETRPRTARTTGIVLLGRRARPRPEPR